MKFDEATYFDSSVAYAKCSEKPIETGMTGADNEVKGEEKHGMDVLESQTYDVDAGVLPYEKSAGSGEQQKQEPRNYTFMKKSVIERLNEGADMNVPCFIPIAEVELSRKEADLYTDKTITEIELKDICVDEGVPSQDKMLVEIDQLDHKTDTDFPCSDLDGESDLTKKEVDNGISALDGLVTLRQLILSEDKELSSGGLHKSGAKVDSTNEIVKDFTDGKVMSDKLLIDYFDTRSQASSEESTSTLPSAAEESKISHNMVHLGRKMDNSSITFDFDTHAPTTSCRDDHSEDTDGQLSAQSLVEPGLKVGVLEGASASSRSILTQPGHGETSFSGMGVFSGPIAYSGSIPYSGSISLRSDSSTTSTRSFAFPVLQTEWNSSPVKMAKADRRLYRKHKGWLWNFICCRF